MNSTYAIRTPELFVLVFLSQVGIGVFALPFDLYSVARVGGWVSCLVIGAISQIAILAIWYATYFRRREASSSTLPRTFEGGLRRAAMLGYSAYALCISAVILRYWVDLSREWVFPITPEWFVGGWFVAVSAYLVSGGVPALKRFAPTGLWAIPIALFIMGSMIPDMEPSRLIAGEESYGLGPIGQGMRAAMQAFLGFETLWLWLPRAEGKPSRTLLAATLANGLSTALNTTVVLGCYAYFSDGQFRIIPHPVLYMLKSKSFIFVERTDLLVMTFWIPLVLTTFSAYLALSTAFASRALPFLSNRSAVLGGALAVAGLAYALGAMDLGEEKLLNFVILAGTIFAYALPFAAAAWTGWRRRRGASA